MAGGGLVCGLDEWDQEVFDCVEELRVKSLSAGGLLVKICDIETVEELQLDACLHPFQHARRQEKKKKKLTHIPHFLSATRRSRYRHLWQRESIAR